MNHITVEIGLIDPTDIYNLISFDPHEAFGEWDGLSFDESGVKVLIDAVSVTGDEIFNALSEAIDMNGFYDTLVVINKGGDIHMIDSEILTRFSNIVLFAGGEVKIYNHTNGIDQVIISANTAKLDLKHVDVYQERVSVATKCGAEIKSDPEFNRPIKVAKLTSVGSFAAQCFENAARNKANAAKISEPAVNSKNTTKVNVSDTTDTENNDKGSEENKKEGGNRTKL